MMKSRNLFGILLAFALLCAALSGCGGPAAEQPTLEQPTPEQPTPEQPDVEWPDMISVYGVCYQRGPALDSEPRPEDVDILGYLNYTGREKAFRHAQANFPAAQGAPVARSPLADYSEGMIARLPDGWTLFLPMEPEPTEPGEQGDGETWTHIRVDGITYVPDTPRFGPGLSLQIEDSQILGYLTYTGDMDTPPSRDGETNFIGAQGAPYARCPQEEYSEGLIVLCGGCWWLFLPEAQ